MLKHSNNVSQRSGVYLVLVTGRGRFCTQLEVLGSLQAQLLLRLTFLAFQTQNDLSCCLGLLVKHRLCLSTVTHLLGVVSAFSLGEIGSLTRLVLRHLVQFMLLAFSSTVCLALFGDIHHRSIFLLLTI